MKRSRIVGNMVAAMLVAAGLSWPGAASAIQLTIEADTFVNASSINQNNGSATSLKVGPNFTTYLKFDLTPLPPGTTAADIEKATLTVYVNTVTTQGPFNVRTPVANGWIPTSLTYGNKPNLGNPSLMTLPVYSADKNNFVTIDVTDVVKSWMANNNGLALETTFGFSNELPDRQQGEHRPRPARRHRPRRRKRADRAHRTAGRHRRRRSLRRRWRHGSRGRDGRRGCHGSRRARRVSRVPQVPPARRVSRVSRVPRVPPARRVSRVPPAEVVLRVPQALKVIPVLSAPRARPALPA